MGQEGWYLLRNKYLRPVVEVGISNEHHCLEVYKLVQSTAYSPRSITLTFKGNWKRLVFWVNRSLSNWVRVIMSWEWVPWVIRRFIKFTEGKITVMFDGNPGEIRNQFCESQCEVQVSQGLSFRESNVGSALFIQDAAVNQESMLLDFSWNFFQSLQDTPEIDLAVYQEMWFPVAVVAGVTVILIFLAIVCLVSHSIPNLLSYCNPICR